MRFIGIVFLAMLLVSPQAFSADKTHPNFLRQKHAGTVSFSSSEPLHELFPKVLKATQECWIGKVKPGVGTMYSGGALGTMSSASRDVLGELSADAESSYVVVRAKGFFGAIQSNFLQIDLNADSTGTRLDVYWQNNVKGQKALAIEVDHWLKGDLSYCEPKPFMQKRSD